MDLGHGFIPRIDARNYKAVERCLTRDGPGLFHEALDLPWALLEGPWALQHGAATLELCRDRGVSVLVDTQAWRYHDPRTFLVDKFTAPPYAPPAPLNLSMTAQLEAFVTADLETQAVLGAAAFLLPGAVPTTARDGVHDITLALIEAARATALAEPRPCIAFVGAHSSSMDDAHALIDELPLWLEGVYIQVTPSNPLRDSTAKLIDALVLTRHAAQRGFTVLGGRAAALGPLARALGIHATDAGLGEGESFVYASKMKNHEPRSDGSSSPKLLGGRVYVPQLGRSVSAAEWSRLMAVPALRGQLLCRLPCCAFGQPVESTPSRGREHSLHSRVAEARQYSSVGTTAIGQVARLYEQRQSVARAVTNALVAADLPPIYAEHTENHLAAARFFAGSDLGRRVDRLRQLGVAPSRRTRPNGGRPSMSRSGPSMSPPGAVHESTGDVHEGPCRPSTSRFGPMRGSGTWRCHTACASSERWTTTSSHSSASASG